MKNIKLNIAASDYRPAFVFDDVRNLNIDSVIINGDGKPKHFILHKTEDAKIDDKKSVLIK